MRGNRAIAKVGLAGLLLLSLVRGAAAEEVTTTTSTLACVTEEAYGKFSRDVQATGDERRTVADAVLSHACRLFDAGTIFVIEKARGPVIVRVRVKGGHDSFWTSRLLLR